MNEELESWELTEEEEPQRLDRCVAEELAEFSRVFLQNLIKQGKVKVFRNDQVLAGKRRPSDKVIAGDRIEVLVPEEESFELDREDFDLPILFEDEYMLVINKPAGLVVHPGAGNHTGTLVNALIGKDEERFRAMAGDDVRPGIVHRLDKETSGVIVVAKTKVMQDKLSAAFAGRNIDKMYLALTRDKMRDPVGSVHTYIGRSPTNRQMMAVTFDENRGKEAMSHYRVLGQNKRANLVKVKIETGRTHQIRVHMAHLGHPVIGDKLYSKKRQEMNDSPGRHILHAWKLRMYHPVTEEEMTFEAPIPDDFIKIVEKFGLQIK